MALTRSTLVAVVAEVTEGTYVAPASGADYVQIVDVPAFNPEVEQLDRNLIKGSIGRLKPLHGIRSGTMELGIELRSGGVTGIVVDAPEADVLLESAFGRKTTPGNATTVGGSTDTDINVDTGEGAAYEKGDVVHIDGELRFVRSVAGDVLTLNRALDKGAPAAAVDVIGGYTYKPANDSHDPLSITVWYGDEWEARGVGCRVSNVAFTDFATGQIPKLTLTLEMLDYDSVAASSPFTPTFNATPPPVAIGGNVYRSATGGGSDTLFCVNNIEMTMAQTVTPEECITNTGGRSRLFITDREVTGTVDPQVDAANISIWTDFVDNTDFELEVGIASLDASDDFIAGEGVGLWMPFNNFTGVGFEDSDGTMVHSLPFSAHESVALQDEIFLGFV